MKTKGFFVLLALGLFFTSCRDTVTEREVVRETEVQVEKEEVAPEVEDEEGIIERTGKEIDQEINQEIDEEIQKIGDDNQ